MINQNWAKQRHVLFTALENCTNIMTTVTLAINILFLLEVLLKSVSTVKTQQGGKKKLQ